MSDETAKQIKYLIEVTQQDIQMKASLLADVVEGEILVSEMLQDIKLDVADIKDGLFRFFNDEQIRFKTQQDQADEQYFRTLEALREARGDTPTPETPEDQEDGQPKQVASGGLGGLGNLGLGLLGAGAIGRFLVGRFLPAAAIAGVVTGVIDYMAERPRILERLSAEGLTGEDLETEATTQALGEVMSDFSDNVVEPLVEPIAVLAAKEFGFNDKEIIELRKKVDNLSKVFEKGTEDLVDMFSTFFGRESSRAALREDQEQIDELQQEINQIQGEAVSLGLMTPEGQLTDETAQDLSRLEEISARQEEMRGLPKASTSEESRERAGEVGRLREEKRQLRVKLAPVLNQQEIIKQRQELETKTKLSQAGYEAGDLQTTAQASFNELTSNEKSDFIKKQVSPAIKAAEEAGAVDVNEALFLSNLPGATMSGGIAGIPLSIDSLEALENLSPEQLQALLINDDILNNSTLQVGAMETSDRKIVEYIYRMKTEGAADPRLAPVQTASPESQGALQSAQSTLDAANQLSASFVTSVTPSPTVSAAVPVNDMSRNMVAQSSAPIVISTSQGGSQVTNMVNNSSTTVLGGGAPARSSDISSQRLFDRMQYT